MIHWLIDGVEYRDPYSGRPVAIEAAIDQLDFWRQVIDRNRGLVVAAGIARWKRREVEAMLWPGDNLVFAGNAADAVEAALRAKGRDRGLAVKGAARAGRGSRSPWRARASSGGRLPPFGRPGERLPPTAFDHLRPCGPPSRPQSPLRPRGHDRSPCRSGTARPCRTAHAVAGRRRHQQICERRGSWERPVKDRRIVLVTGQVEDDLSVQLGGAGVEGNLDLIRRARAAEPDAWLVFKPHPMSTPATAAVRSPMPSLCAMSIRSSATCRWHRCSMRSMPCMS